MELDKFESSSDIKQLLAIRERVGELGQTLERSGDLSPKIDLLDHGEAFELVVEVPGVPQDDLEVAIQGRSVIVAGIREPHENSGNLLHSERQKGHFQRSIELPAEIEREHSRAHLREGLLILHLPKTEDNQR